MGSREVWTLANGKALRRRGDGWKLVHQGIHVNSDTVPFFELEGLQVRGQPLRASPDLVFRNQITGQVLVVEIKLSRQSLPSNLWPNIWAQLWCYSQKSIAKNAPKVTVTGEVWGDNTWRGSRRLASMHLLYLRSSCQARPARARLWSFFSATFRDLLRTLVTRNDAQQHRRRSALRALLAKEAVAPAQATRTRLSGP